MALLNQASYGELGKVSSGVSTRVVGKFSSVFLTGALREGEDIGKFQCKFNLDQPDFLVHNAESVLFIPYFIKRYWEKHEQVKSDTSENSYPKLVAQGWDEDVPKIDETCKYAYTIAGLLLDPETKKAVKHEVAHDDANVAEGSPVLIHFKCSGMKFNGAMKFMEALSEKAKTLPPLSDSPEFEKNVVTPRRFICQVEKELVESQHGTKMAFKFTPVVPLQDKAVESVMNSAKTLVEDFEKQFNKQDTVTPSSTPAASDNPGFATEKVAPPPESKPAENEPVFDIGLDI